MQGASALVVVATGFVLFVLAYQDFRSREIYWFLPPFLCVTGCFGYGVIEEWQIILKSLLLNWLVLSLQLLAVWGYFAILKGSAKQFFDVCIGWGDILFLYAIAPFFSLFNYVAFMLFSLIVCLLAVFANNFFAKKQLVTVPLAGIFSVCLIVVLATEIFCETIDLHDDILLLYILV